MSLWSILGTVAGAVVGGPAGAAIGGSIGGALDSKNATDKAVETQANAAKDANAATLKAQQDAQAFQQKQLDQARADNEPWRVAGGGAVNRLAAQPDFSFTGANVATDPGYQFGLSEGMKGLTNSAAARGGLLSGAALKASTKYAQDYAGTKFNDSFSRALQTRTSNDNRLQSLAGIGMSSVGSTTAAGGQVGANVGAGINQAGQSLAQNALGVGNARASGYLANNNALTGAVNQGVSAWNNYNALAKPPTAGEVGSSGWYANNDYLTS